MKWPIETLLALKRTSSGRTLSIRVPLSRGPADQFFRFSNRDECRLWAEKLESLRTPSVSLNLDATLVHPKSTTVPVIQRRPTERFQNLGHADGVSEDRGIANAILQVHAKRLFGDAVADIQTERLVEYGRTLWRISGSVIRAVDERGQREINMRWLDERLGTITYWFAVLTVASMAVSGMRVVRVPLLYIPAFAIAVVLIYIWPIVLLLALRFLRWPQLLPAASVTNLVVGVALSPLAGLYVLIGGPQVPHSDHFLGKLLLAIGGTFYFVLFIQWAWAANLSKKGLHLYRKYRAAALTPQFATKWARPMVLIGGIVLSVLHGVGILALAVLQVIQMMHSAP
jgi:hypothetical protein